MIKYSSRYQHLMIDLENRRSSETMQMPRRIIINQPQSGIFKQRLPFRRCINKLPEIAIRPSLGSFTFMESLSVRSIPKRR